MLPQKIAFIDVETTGLSPTYERVIEVGLVRVADGELVDEYSTLVNPERRIPAFIKQHTGISTKMVADAPVFSEIVDELAEKLEGYTFVAHNVNFDYSFLKAEFGRLDYGFTMPKFCTAQLSRRLYPQHRRHSLDHIIERFGFDCEKRHRALDDVKILWQFYQAVQQEFAPHLIAACL